VKLTSNAIRRIEAIFIRYAALRRAVECVCADFAADGRGGARLESRCGGGCEGQAGHCEEAEEVGGEHFWICFVRFVEVPLFCLVSFRFRVVGWNSFRRLGLSWLQRFVRLIAIVRGESARDSVSHAGEWTSLIYKPLRALFHRHVICLVFTSSRMCLPSRLALSLCSKDRCAFIACMEHSRITRVTL
jgi:hypothetical protein